MEGKFPNGLILVLLSILGIACQNCGFPEKTINPEVSSQPEDVLNISTNDQLNVQSCGNGDTTLLFIHGWCINQTYWKSQVEVFCSDYTVVTLDLPGFGKSPGEKADLSIKGYAKTISNLITSKNLRNVIAVGHSMSGDISLELALLNESIIGLVGVEAFQDVSMDYNAEMMGEIDDFIQILSSNYKGIAPAYAEGSLISENTPDDLRNMIVDDFTFSDSLCSIEALKNFFAYLPIESKRLSQVKVPVVIINAEVSNTDTVSIRNLGLELDFYEISNSGHFPMIEHPEQFNDALLKALIKMNKSND